MENNAKYPKYDFYNARAMMQQLYPIVSIQEDDFLEQAFYTWKGIGNFYSSAHVYIAEVTADNKLDIPDNVDSVLNVTFPKYYLSHYGLNNILAFVNGSIIMNSGLRDEWDSYRIDGSIKTRYGHFISYRLEDGYITFDQADFSGIKVAVLYDGLIVDEDCNPRIFYKEVEAIAHNVAYNKALIMASRGDIGVANILSLIKQEADRSLRNARTPEEITFNQWDTLLDIKTSFGRKHYNRNYKFRS